MTKTRLYPIIFCLLPLIIILGGCGTQTGSPWVTRSDNTHIQVDNNPAPPRVEPTYKTPNTNNAGNFANLPDVKVAILLPLSGNRSAIGQSMLQAAQLALFEMGYSNLNLIPRDTKGTANGAAAAASSAINEGAQLILGPLFGSSVSAVKNIAAPNNVNVIAFSTDWNLADRNTFLMGFLPFSQVDRIAGYMSEQDIRNVALIAPQDKYGNAVSNHFENAAAQNRMAIVQKIRFNVGDDIAAKISSLNAKETPPNFQAVFMPVGGSMVETISSALSYHHLMPQDIKRLGTGLWDDPRIAGQPNMQGGWFAAPAPSARQQFEQTYFATYGQRPARLSTLAYDATALAAILARRGFESTGAPAFGYTDLTNPNGFVGTDGIFRFRQNGLVERGLAILELRNGQIIEIDAAPTRF